MLPFHKTILTFFVTLQLLSTQLCGETTSHIAYIPGGASLIEGVNAELDRIQENAYIENKFFEFVSITLSIHVPTGWGFISNNMYVIYNLSDKNGETNSFITKVAYASSWTYSGIHASIQEEINSLQNFALSENKTINYLDIKMSDRGGNAYIIYEISK